MKKTSFKANSKALAEKEAEGMAKMIYRADTGEILGMWIMVGLYKLNSVDPYIKPLSQTAKQKELISQRVRSSLLTLS